VPVLVRNTPPGYDWAFYSREEPRMHLQTTPDAKTDCKVWLEAQGQWSIEKSGDVPSRVFNALRSALETQPQLAWRVRAQWVRQMILKGWLTLSMDRNGARLISYPGMPHSFERPVDLSRQAPSSWLKSPQDAVLDPETASLTIGAGRPEHERVLVDLADLLWEQPAVPPEG
jgi:hypothetical protein